MRWSTFRTEVLQKDFITIQWSKPLHIVFVELVKNKFYLAHVQSEYNQSASINKTIQTSDYCPHINELFNETIRQIKYYHLLCQNLSCFRDEMHLCICYGSICRCKPCYHGRQCQYRTGGFGLSLEGILGSQILPIKSLSKQPTIIQTSFALIVASCHG